MDTPITSTPKKNLRMDATRLGTRGGAYSGPASIASRNMPLTAAASTKAKPRKTLAATFCGYPSDEERMDLV